VMRLSPAVRLVIRIGSGLLVAAAIAVALTVPAPAFDERCMIMASSATSGYQPVYVRSWQEAGVFGAAAILSGFGRTLPLPAARVAGPPLTDAVEKVGDEPCEGSFGRRPSFFSPQPTYLAAAVC
jgi:hypothetical protein